jgi:hypothetical protein
MKWDKQNKDLVLQLLNEKSRPWDLENKKALDRLPPSQRILYDPPVYDLPGLVSWNQFLDSFGIDRVERGFAPFVDHLGLPCLKRSHLLGVWRLAPPYHNTIYPDRGREINWSGNLIYPEKNYGNPAQSNKHIIVEDPFLDRGIAGLRIPKDIAEKFLVLGVP